MATKPQIALALAAATTFAVSLGTGTFLAHRSKTPESTEAGQPVSDTAAPVTETKTLTPLTHPSVAPPDPKPVVRPSAPTRATAPSAAPSTAASRDNRAAAPRATTEPVTSSTQPATPTPPPPDWPVAPPVSATTVEAPPVREPAKPRFEEVVVQTDAVIGIRLDQTISSETAKVEDRVSARVARDVTVDGRTVLPVGTKLEGVITVVERGGKIRDRAKIGLKFNQLIMPDGLRVPIQTDTIFREGDSPTGEASKKIGTGAVAGAILGAVIGGKKGAVIGAATGAGGGSAVVMASDRNQAVFTNGSPLTVRLTAPVTITIEKDPSIR